MLIIEIRELYFFKGDGTCTLYKNEIMYVLSGNVILQIYTEIDGVLLTIVYFCMGVVTTIEVTKAAALVAILSSITKLKLNS